jgi:ubiquinone/menaquinone biosynthesis C-methylase UbiE
MCQEAITEREKRKEPKAMPLAPEPKREQPSTYFVEDRSSQDELNRLRTQDQMLTTSMGGVLPEQPDSTAILRVLDVGCGTGDWLIELAQTTPTCTLLVGVDASIKFVEYARAQAEAAQVSNRVEFHVMDALRMLEFPPKSFDLVNQRLASSWLRTWDWRKLLQEYQRVTRPGGVIRITEGDAVSSNSPALNRFTQLFVQAFYQSGHLFTPEGNGVINQLAHLLHQHGIQQVQTRAYALEYRFGTPTGQAFIEDGKHFVRTMLPFLRKWTQVPDDYEELCQQTLDEMQQPDFVATLGLLTAWGQPQPSKALPGGDFAR